MSVCDKCVQGDHKCAHGYTRGRSMPLGGLSGHAREPFKTLKGKELGSHGDLTFSPIENRQRKACENRNVAGRSNENVKVLSV